jgi:hypothetical protein
MDAKRPRRIPAARARQTLSAAYKARATPHLPVSPPLWRILPQILCQASGKRRRGEEKGEAEGERKKKPVSGRAPAGSSRRLRHRGRRRLCFP